MTTKEFNLLELAAELADLKLIDTFAGQIMTENEENYTEDAQDRFNELYDEFYEFLTNL